MFLGAMMSQVTETPGFKTSPWNNLLGKEQSWLSPAPPDKSLNCSPAVPNSRSLKHHLDNTIKGCSSINISLFGGRQSPPKSGQTVKICSVLGRLSQIQEKNHCVHESPFCFVCGGGGPCWHFDELFCFVAEVLIYVPCSIDKLGTLLRSLIWRQSCSFPAAWPDTSEGLNRLCRRYLAKDLVLGSQSG